MTQKKSDDFEDIAFWREAHRRLKLVDREPPIARERTKRLLAALPVRRPGESLGDWLRRIRSTSSPSTGKIIPFRAKPQWHFTPLVAIRRLAADSGGSEIPLPDPGRALETEDGRFRLTITAGNGKLQIMVETLGLAIDAFANQRLGLAGPRGEDELIAIIELNADGDGRCVVEDWPEVRRALLHPIIGLVKEAAVAG